MTHMDDSSKLHFFPFRLSGVEQGFDDGIDHQNRLTETKVIKQLISDIFLKNHKNFKVFTKIEIVVTLDRLNQF